MRSSSRCPSCAGFRRRWGIDRPLHYTRWIGGSMTVFWISRSLQDEMSLVCPMDNETKQIGSSRRVQSQMSLLNLTWI
jgi:hypothetical protein